MKHYPLPPSLQGVNTLEHHNQLKNWLIQFNRSLDSLHHWIQQYHPHYNLLNKSTKSVTWYNPETIDDYFSVDDDIIILNVEQLKYKEGLINNRGSDVQIKLNNENKFILPQGFAIYSKSNIELGYDIYDINNYFTFSISTAGDLYLPTNVLTTDTSLTLLWDYYSHATDEYGLKILFTIVSNNTRFLYNDSNALIPTLAKYNSDLSVQIFNNFNSFDGSDIEGPFIESYNHTLWTGIMNLGHEMLKVTNNNQQFEYIELPDTKVTIHSQKIDKMMGSNYTINSKSNAQLNDVYINLY